MKFKVSLFVAALAAAPFAAAADEVAPGGRMSAGMKPPAAGVAMLQGESPLQAIHAHVCGLHFYSGDLQRQVIVHHYCTHLSEDLLQCVLYDSDQAGARLIGIEYVISAKLFLSLPEEEKKLWHSHVYEVKSGLLLAPELSTEAERALMKEFAGTYGKTWQTWQVDRGDQVPLGIPQLMMGFTADGQAKPELLAARDRMAKTSSAEKKKARADLVAPAIQPGADAWQNGEAIQLQPVLAKPASPAGR